MMRPPGFLPLAVTTALFSFASALAGQERPAVAGRVLEFSTDAPVADALVDLLDARDRPVARTTTDADGAFRFDNLRPGPYRLRATSLGYRDVVTPELTVADAPLTVIVRVAVDAVPLAPLEVVTRASRPLHANPAIADFLERSRRRMGGTFFLREEIDERQPWRVTSLLRMVGSLVVVDHAREGVVYNNRSQCAPALFIDGRYRGGGVVGYRGEGIYNGINALHWSEIEGIEVYAGAATTPAQFSGSRAGCGVIAIWTRR